MLNESADDIPETTRGLIEALEPWQSIPVTLEAYPRAAPAAPAVPAADEDELESTALMDSVPDELPDEDTVVRAPEPSVPPARSSLPPPEPPARSAWLERERRRSPLSLPSPPNSAIRTMPTARTHPSRSRELIEAEQQRAAQAAEEKARRASEEAKSLVTDLRLDQKRSSTTFPGQLDLALPSPEEPLRCRTPRGRWCRDPRGRRPHSRCHRNHR